MRVSTSFKTSPVGSKTKEVLQNLKKNDFYLISDTHFFHKNILEYEPSRKVIYRYGYLEQEDFLMDRWNERVGSNDWVLHLGDFSFKESDEELLTLLGEMLNGNKILILGNHDKKPLKFYEKFFKLPIGEGTIYVEHKGEFFKIDAPYKFANGLILEFPKVGKVFFTHYPVKTPPPWQTNTVKFLKDVFETFGCSLNLHGHTHSKSLNDPQSVNLSVEVIDFTPKRLSEVLDAVKSFEKST